MKNIYKYLLLLAVSAGSYSCESLVDDLNEDPNNPGDAPAELMLPGAELANVMVQEGDWARLAGMWTGYFTGVDRQYASLNQYVTTSGDYDATWGNLYAGVVKNTRIIRAKAEAGNNPSLGAVASIIEANAVGTAAALFGDVPFREAANPEFPSPAYDPQEQVYADLQQLLTDAIEALEEGRGTIPSTSIHGLSRAAWIEVAHTLKARYYMHTRQYEEAYEEAQMGISTLGNSLSVDHGSTYGGNLNLFNSFMDWDRPGYMSARDGLAPRLLFADEASYRGNTKTNEEARANFAYITDEQYAEGYEPNFYGYWWGTAPGLFGADATYYIVSYMENQLTLAEAGARTQGFEVGLQHLNEYRAFLNDGGYLNADYVAEFELEYSYEPYTLLDFTLAGVENPDGTAPLNALMREILEERYITFIGHIEGFNDMRRLNNSADPFYNFRVMVTPNTGTALPERFLYPQAEINSNPSVPSPQPGLFQPTPIND
ncbi:SusD/RagB family nutrient-binding outer membrane lipoprotein [Cesiribacter andamanensis]|uniref:Starch-binding associating with outer membrane n=1 Tax=Cesiribacter andamanensis AMV16 TaxID=1279009 RepID=M7NRW8_9BACT|nr:SusD/RagB family nutrient-binding outer membrane lipoprotein [Cesiribacter andamanensis]EMR04440.1 Starch-binding associating with outer membrane [Cesiribacter andamanensis AMV16]